MEFDDTDDFQRKIRTELSESIFYDINDGRAKIAYVFNHYMFNIPPDERSAPPTRSGTERDNKRICECLENKGFQVQKFQDPYKHKIAETLQKASELKRSQVSCIVIVIMSHGDKDIIFARDQSYPITLLFNPFMRKACDLNGIPKLYFIQACRGDKLDDGHMEFDGPGYSPPYDIPPCPDMLCVFSTAEDHLSWRNRLTGSWFIQSLCQCLEKYEGKKNLLHLLTDVNNDVATEYASKTYDPDKKSSLLTHNKKQISHVVSSLTKLIML